MSYRNDHDAALARVDALQLEVERLRETAAKVAVAPVVRPRRSSLRTLGSGLIAALVLVGAAGVGFGVADESPARASSERIAAIDTRVDGVELDACLAAIQPSPAMPAHGVLSPSDVRAVQQTAAPCRLALPEMIESGLWSPTQRASLETWLAAEDELANSLGLITAYYAGTPETSDGYASAPQLWLEYSRAHAKRDAAVVVWRATL